MIMEEDKDQTTKLAKQVWAIVEIGQVSLTVALKIPPPKSISWNF